MTRPICRVKLVLLLLTAATGLGAADDHLARVAILTFEDRTGTKNYGYLPGSLTEAVDRSLQKKFEYLREDPAKSEQAFRAAFPNRGTGSLRASEASAFARRHGYDIVIYGFFTLDLTTVSGETKSEIVVKTFVSPGGEEKLRALKERKNPADATIFSLADKVADDIVAEMTAVAKERTNAEKPVAQSGKLELKRESVTSWDARKWLVSAEAGISGPLTEEQGLKDGIHIALRLNKEFWRRAYWGFDLGYASTGNSYDSCGGNLCSAGGRNFDALYGTGVLGYALFPGNRWRIFADVGFGSAFGGFLENLQAYSGGEGKTEQLRFAIRGAAGLDFLITPFLSLGLGMRILAFPGSTDAYAVGQPAIRLAFSF